LRFTARSAAGPCWSAWISVERGQNMAYIHEDPREFFLVIDASGVT
jgi:hypothetical protein